MHLVLSLQRGLIVAHISVDAPFNGHTCQISNPHSNAVVDFDGDCLAGMYLPTSFPQPSLTYFPDVFLLCDEPSGHKSFQIWINEKEKGFTFAKSGALPIGIGAVSFADMGSSRYRLWTQCLCHLPCCRSRWHH